MIHFRGAPSALQTRPPTPLLANSQLRACGESITEVRAEKKVLINRPVESESGSGNLNREYEQSGVDQVGKFIDYDSNPDSRKNNRPRQTLTPSPTPQPRPKPFKNCPAPHPMDVKVYILAPILCGGLAVFCSFYLEFLKKKQVDLFFPNTKN